MGDYTEGRVNSDVPAVIPGVVREAHASTFEPVACLASGLARSASDRLLIEVMLKT